MSTPDHISRLWERFSAKQASPAELDEFFQLLSDPTLDAGSLQFLREQMETTMPETLDEERWQPIIQSILDQRKQAIIRDLHSSKTRWGRGIRIAAAVAVFLLFAIPAWLFLHRNQPGQAPAGSAQISPGLLPPSANHATITLANGQRIDLDNAARGGLATQGKSRLVKLANGQIAYQASSPFNNELIYNTLSNPRGSRVVNLTLSDGSRVWLNAESSIRYPAQFSGPNRAVEINGEAYFEIANNPSRPFIVRKGTAEIQVLGTAFDIDSYEEEHPLRITLLQGSVKIRAGSAITLLRPGQLAEWNEKGAGSGAKIKIVDGADTERIVAWKNGIFHFESQPIREIMAELGRWYDAQPVYEGQLPSALFSARISRDNNINELLKLFELTKEVHFRIENKKIYVMK